MPVRPRVGVVTINWNGLEDTRRCLQSLGGVTYQNLRVFVVDNGSADDQAATLAAEHPWCRVLPQQSNLGFSEGCNVGIAEALADGADYILLLNNDTQVTPGFLEPLVEFAERTPGAGAVGSLILYDTSDTVWSAGGHLSILTGFTHIEGKGQPRSAYTSREPFPTEFIAGACLLVDSGLVRQVGLLDPEYFAYYEDIDWCYRFRAAGRVAYTVPASVIDHRKSASTGAAGTNKLSPVAAYFMARNALYFGRKHLTGARRWWFTLMQFVLRAPYNLAFRTQPGAKRPYLRGLAHGVRPGENPTPS
jgi:GT2 family glycosyltransferase